MIKARKYRIRDKKNRNNDMVSYIHNNPDLTLEEVGEHFNISQGRVSQILKKIKRKL